MNIDKIAIRDKIEFIIFHISLGLIFWLVTASLVALKQTLLGYLGYPFLNVIKYLSMFILIMYFWSRLNTKIQWKPFGKYSGFISFCFEIGTIIALFLSVGYFEISIIKV